MKQQPCQPIFYIDSFQQPLNGKGADKFGRKAGMTFLSLFLLANDIYVIAYRASAPVGATPDGAGPAIRATCSRVGNLTGLAFMQRSDAVREGEKALVLSKDHAFKPLIWPMQPRNLHQNESLRKAELKPFV